MAINSQRYSTIDTNQPGVVELQRQVIASQITKPGAQTFLLNGNVSFLLKWCDRRATKSECVECAVTVPSGTELTLYPQSVPQVGGKTRTKSRDVGRVFIALARIQVPGRPAEDRPLEVSFTGGSKVKVLPETPSRVRAAQLHVPRVN